MQKVQIRDFVMYVAKKKQRCLIYQNYRFYLKEWKKNQNKKWVCVQSECQCQLETSEDNVLVSFKGEHSHSNRLVQPPLNNQPTLMRAYMENKNFREVPMHLQRYNKTRLIKEVYRKCNQTRKTILRMVVLQMTQLYSIFDDTRMKFRLRLTTLKI